jgi:predicted nucleic acid-binding protein
VRPRSADAGSPPAETAAAEKLFAGLLVLPIDARVAWWAGPWRQDHAANGVTLWQADCLVAAAAVVHGARLVTGNPEDFPMAGLDLAHWPVGARAVLSQGSQGRAAP